jgi:hypothetical protein
VKPVSQHIPAASGIQVSIFVFRVSRSHG